MIMQKKNWMFLAVLLLPDVLNPNVRKF